MAFVNEYIPEEDIIKYKFKEFFLQYCPEYNEVPASFQPEWTIDRDRNIYMIRGKSPNQLHLDHPDDMWSEFIINWNGTGFICRLKGGNTSINTDSQPYFMEWDLINITPEPSNNPSKDEIISALKETLTVYGYRGIWEQIPNTVVKFKF